MDARIVDVYPIRVDYLTDGTTETTTYDAFGNKRTAANNLIAYSFGYDNLNRLLSKTDSRQYRSMSFTYDRTGNILTKTDFQNDVTEYTYDAANRRVAMKNNAYLEASYQHDGAGRVLTRTLSNGAATQLTYDANGWLASLTQRSANGTSLSNTTYTRDRTGHLTGQVDSSGTTNYTYDALYRLTGADYPGTANDENFTYDAVGNRLVHTLNGSAHYYEYWPTSNRVKALHTGSLTGPIEKSLNYDDAGRLTSQTGTTAKTITWDQKHHALQMTAGSNTNTFQYDPMDYRIGRTGGTLGAKDYYLDGEHLEAEYNNNTIQAKYFRGLSTDELIAGYQYANGQGTPSIYHHDPLTSVTGISTADGQTLQTQTYSAFGDRTITTTGTSTNRLKYTGREQDPDTGLYYYRARYYDPSIGRFISEDPLGFQAGINFYSYVKNDPVDGNDPSGEDTQYSASFGGTAAMVLLGVGGNVSAGISIPDDPTNWRGYQVFGSVQANLMGGGGGFLGYGFSVGRAVSDGPLKPGISLDGGWYAEVDAGVGPVAVGASLQGPGEALGSLPAAGSFTPLPKVGQGVGFWVAPVGSYGSATAASYTLGHVVDSVTGLFGGGSISPAPVPAGATPTSSLDISFGAGAAGGFLLYPNKPNNNQILSVYSK